MTETSESTVPQVSPRDVMQSQFERRYRASSFQYNVIVPYAIGALGMGIAGIVKTLLARKGLPPELVPATISAAVYTAFVLYVCQSGGARYRAERAIAGGTYDNVKTGGAMLTVADNAAWQDCVLPRTCTAAKSYGKRLAVYLPLGNG